MYDQKDPNEIHYERGFPLGINSHDGSKYIFNHIQFVIKYHKGPDYEGARIVGFEVFPFSVKHKYEGEQWNDAQKPELTTCNKDNLITREKEIEWQKIDEPTEVIFTYDVHWEASEIPWAQRWNVYLQGSSDDEIHWYVRCCPLMVSCVRCVQRV